MAERAKTYGSPRDRFATATRLFESWKWLRDQQEQLPEEDEQALRHGVYLLCDKLSRLAVSPRHLDNLTDIQGYSECIRSFMDEK